jgi:transcriptional regulator with XRE-family HTH domain
MITVLRLARVRTGLTLRAFARRYGLSEVTLCKIERGAHYIPPTWRPRLAAALGLPVEAICDERGWPRWVQ